MSINEYEEFALGQFLSGWNGNATYQEIINYLNSPESYSDEEYDRLEISVWEPFVDYEYEWVANEIESIKTSVERRFIVRGETTV